MWSEWDNIVEAEASYLYNTWGIIYSYEGMFENRLDSLGMNLKPQQSLKHLGSDSGLQGYLNWEAQMCLWLAQDKPVLEPPASTAFRNWIAKSGIAFQIQPQVILGLVSFESLHSRILGNWYAVHKVFNYTILRFYEYSNAYRLVK